MKIASFNVKDDSINSHGGIRENGVSNASIVSEFIKKEKFDFIGTQELTYDYKKTIKKQLNGYDFYGGYRYGNLLKPIPYNENNNILTNKKVIEKKTYWLPWIADNFNDLKKSIIKKTIMPRIATIIIFDNGNNDFMCMINTHLDYETTSIQMRQLEKLKKIIKKYSDKYPTIITGDFNMEVGEEKFDNFINTIKNYGISRVPIEGNTCHDNARKKRKIDHIFIPSDWYIKDAGIIDSKGTSDHDLIYVDAEVE